MKSINTLIKSSLIVIFALVSISTIAQQRFDVQTSGSSAFVPGALTINVGDTVVWTNTGGSHNVNGTQATFPSNPESFGGFTPSSGLPNWPFEHVFTIPGSYDYRCDPHFGNGMTGTIQVNAVSTGPCSDLFISEYIEGSGVNKGLELYNPTSDTINLSDYQLERYSNGASTPVVIGLPGSVAPYDVVVLARPDADSAMIAVADTLYTSQEINHNGNDAYALRKISSNTIIDVFGEIGVNPGSSWSITGINGVSATTANQTLVRDPSVTFGDTSWNSVVSNQWYVLPSNYFDALGTHNAQVCGSAIPAYLIEQIKGLDASLVPDSLGVQAQITGIVHNPDQGFNSSEFAIQDGTAGIWVTGADPIPGYPSGTNEGDIVRVFGTVSFSNGVTQFAADSINLLGNTSLYAAEQVDTLNEYSEGRYVRLDSVRIINNTQDSFDIGGGGVNYTIVTLQLDTFEMRVDRDYELDFEGNPVPTSFFNVTGVGSQFDGSAPHNSGYQIFPSRYSDLEVFAVTGAAISFTEGNASVPENGSNYQVRVTIGDTVTGGAMIDVVNTGSGTAAIGNDFTFNDTTLTFSGTSIDTFTLNVGIIDNAVVNSDRTVILALRNIAGGGLYGLDTTFTLTIVNDEIPTYTLGLIRGNDNLGGTTNVGVADSLGVVCRSFGLVTSPDIGGSNLSVGIEDGTGAITVFQFGSANPPALVPGDSVEIVGTVGAFNGLSEFVNSTTINVISSGNPLPSPLVVDSLGEFTESRLIRMNEMSFVDASQWPSSPGGPFNIDITNGIDTFVLRVDDDLPLINQTTAPAEPFDVIGFGGQFDNSDPYTSGYQIFAIDSASFIQNLPSVPTYTIGQVDGLDASGVADSLGVECRIVGIAYGENFRAGTNGLEFTLIDSLNNNIGIGVFSTTNLGYTLNEGDMLRVIGTIDQVFGLTRIVADSIVVMSTGNSLKTPSVVFTLNEFSESNLVEYRNLEYISEGNWTNSGASFDVRFADGSDTVTVRIDNDCDLYGTTEPINGTYNITGIGGQLDLTAPFNSGYLLLPRRATDVDFVTSLRDEMNSENLRIYPNPSNGQVTVLGLTNRATEIEVIDLLGKVVFATESNSNSAFLNFNKLKSGQYILRTKSGSEINRSIMVITK